MDEHTKCPGCGAVTFTGERVRHVNRCTLARPVRAPSPRTVALRAAQALCGEPDAALAAALRKDFDDHDK